MATAEIACAFCQRTQGVIAKLEFNGIPGRKWRAEGTITPDGAQHRFDGLTIDDPANREPVTITIEAPHPQQQL